MPEVVIVGAGPLAGELAFLLARRDTTESVALVDEAGQIAAGKALDIVQSAPVESFTTRVSGHTDLYTAAGAPVIVIADKAKGGEWQGEDALMLVRRLMRPGSRSVVICAGASQLTLVEQAVREGRLDRRRIFGSAPEALAASVRAIAALEADRSPSEIALTVLGVPPHHVVIPWEDATVGGFAATRMLDEPARRRLAARVSHLWPPGPIALATAAAQAVAGILGRTRRGLSVFAAPDDAVGVKSRAGAVPVVLGPAGIERVELPTLSGIDRVALDNALLL